MKVSWLVVSLAAAAIAACAQGEEPEPGFLNPETSWRDDPVYKGTELVAESIAEGWLIQDLGCPSSGCLTDSGTYASVDCHAITFSDGTWMIKCGVPSNYGGYRCVSVNDVGEVVKSYVGNYESTCTRR